MYVTMLLSHGACRYRPPGMRHHCSMMAFRKGIQIEFYPESADRSDLPTSTANPVQSMAQSVDLACRFLAVFVVSVKAIKRMLWEASSPHNSPFIIAEIVVHAQGFIATSKTFTS